MRGTPNGSSGVAIPEKPLEVRSVAPLENCVETLAPRALGLDARRCLLDPERHAKAFGERLIAPTKSRCSVCERRR